MKYTKLWAALSVLMLVVLMSACQSVVGAEPTEEAVVTQEPTQAATEPTTQPTAEAPEDSGAAGGTSLAITDLASLQPALADLGADVHLMDPTVNSMFAGNGVNITVNGENLQVFEYETPEAMEADAAKLNPDASTFDGATVDWGPTPMHFWKAGRMIVVYGGMNQDVIDLMSIVMGPQFAGAQ